jgi:hypothetical protein
MRAQESPETSRRALLAALGVAISSMGEPAYAGLFQKSSVGRTTKKDENFEVDKELLATENCTKALAYFKDLKEKFIATSKEFNAAPATYKLKPFLNEVFLVADIRENLNFLTPAFDERTQDTMRFQIAQLIDENARILRDSKFKKGKDVRGAKAGERVSTFLAVAISNLASFLELVE